MKTINCQFCGSQIRKKSSTCQNCGGPVSRVKNSSGKGSEPLPTQNPITIGETQITTSIWTYLGRLYIFSLPFAVVWAFTSYPLLVLIHLSPLLLYMFGHMFYTTVIESPEGDM